MTLPREVADRSLDVTAAYRRPLEALFEPKSVAVIGASETPGSVGRTLLWNLVTSPFGGTVYPVNRSRRSVLGIRSFSSVAEIPEAVDLAVVATPALTVPGVIRDCVDAGVKCAIVISAGFREVGPAGAALEAEMVEEAKRGGLRILGPNCLGLMNPRTGFNATFANRTALPGRIALLTQSGAIATAILDWSIGAQVGFSAFVSVGSMADVKWGELIDHLASDRHTESILIYMESVADAPSFLSAVREVALSKPVIVIKPGRSVEAARAATSHTGALTGSDEVLETALRRVGALRVGSIEDLFSMARVLATQPAPRGPALAIVTNAGGPGVLATDAAVTNGATLPPPSDETLRRMNEILPAAWSHNNPYDILGDAGPDRYKAAVEVLARDPAYDGILVILTPQAMTDPTQTAAAVRDVERPAGKPLVASWMGGPDVAAGREVLAAAGIPNFAYPDDAAWAFALMSGHGDQLRLLYETPEAIDPVTGYEAPAEQGRALLEGVRASGRTLLTELESKQLLSTYGIPTVPTRLAQSADEAVAAADSMGYPAVVKLHSETLTHKTDVGGVKLDLAGPDEVRQAYGEIRASVTERAGEQHFGGVTVQPFVKLEGYELIVGSSIDAQFGPVLLFGAGGQLVEIIKSYGLALPPLTTTLARRLIERTPVARLLQGVRGSPPIDPAELETLLVRFAEIVVDQPAIAEVEINPLLLSHEQLIALDARVVLHGLAIPDAELPRPAIRPYPRHYVERLDLDGTEVTLRPIRPEDEPLVVDFHYRLSPQSVYLRYLSGLPLRRRIAHERLTRICFTDYAREIALVAEVRADGAPQIAGIGRLTRLPGRPDAEFALLIADDFQGKDLGTHLLRKILEIAEAEGIRRVGADMLLENQRMQALSRKFGLRIRALGSGLLHAEIDLPRPRDAAGNPTPE